MQKKRCVKQVIVKATLRNYNKYRDAGWDVAWSGENKFCFEKRVKCPKRGK